MSMLIFIILNLIIYLPFHLFEEAIGDMPKWMFEHKWLPYHMTHGHWMANNLFLYYPPLLISVFLFIINEKFICFGIGILIWGIINLGDHLFYTIKDRKVSPGLVTGILFLFNSILGLKCFISSDIFSVFHLILGILIGGILFGLPIGLCVITYNFFDKYIK
ncbi:MAG: HXXEE domain-containing protein [Oscillospiraceae bacterium]|nr:HXXEE domain-containing protein [Oscillospiraceae bacterium]